MLARFEAKTVLEAEWWGGVQAVTAQDTHQLHSVVYTWCLLLTEVLSVHRAPGTSLHLSITGTCPSLALSLEHQQACVGWEEAAETEHGSWFVVPEASSCGLAIPGMLAGGRSAWP